MKKQNFILGTLFLAVSSFFAKIIGAVYRIPLTNILGAEGLGLYQLIFPLYSTILVFCSTGVPNAIAKLVATGTQKDSKKILKLSLLFFSLLSLAFTLLLILLAKPISQAQGNAQVWLCYVGIAPSIFFVGVISVFRGYFQGKQNIVPTSISNIIEQIFKLLFGLMFAKLLIGKGIMYGAFGAVLGVTLSELFALIIILIDYFLSKKKECVVVNQNVSSYPITLKNILSTAMPITLSGIIMPFTLLIDSFLIINLLRSINFSVSTATNLYGILTGVVNSIINLPVVISMSVATMIIPIISKLYSNKNFYQVNQKSGTAFKLVLAISIPCVAIFLAFANEIIAFLFSNGLKIGEINEFEMASNMLKLASLSILFISIVQISTTLLQSINQSKMPVYNMLVCCSVKVLLTVVLVLLPSLNIYGAVISTLVCYLLCAIFNVNFLLKHIKLKISIKYDIFVPVLSSIMMLTTMQFIKFILGETTLIVPFMMISGGIIYCLIYAVMSYGEKYDFNLLNEYINRLKQKKKNN